MERLKLEVSEEKTKIINLKRNYSYFLGFKIKIKKHKNKYRIVSHMTEKAIRNVSDKIYKQLMNLKRSRINKNKCKKELELYNSIVRGIHNYYNKVTAIREDLHDLNRHTRYFIRTRLKDVLSFSDIKDSITKEVIGKSPNIRGEPILEIGNVNNVSLFCSNEEYNYFESNSRMTFHKDLALDNMFILNQLLRMPNLNESVEFNDNVLSRFCGQLGKYAITNELIFDLKNMRAIKIIENGTGKYNNIIIVDNKTKKIVSAEALSRWDSPQKGLIAPGKYIGNMEMAGLISKHDFYMFELACRQLEKWKDTQFKNITLSCNFTRITLSEENFIDKQLHF